MQQPFEKSVNRPGAGRPKGGSVLTQGTRGVRNRGPMDVFKPARMEIMRLVAEQMERTLVGSARPLRLELAEM